MNSRPEPTIFIAVTPATRQLIENVIEDLLLLLDEIDGDADMEDTGDIEEQYDAEEDPAETGFASLSSK